LSLSLDTNVLIDLVNGKSDLVRSRFAAAIGAGEELATCSLAAHELIFGAMISRRVELQLQGARNLLARLSVTPFDHDDAIAAAQVRAALRVVGHSIGSIDSLIAGQALARGWTVVTANTHEFARIDGLNVIDWTASAD
jgi:tRNA(fMet)-specific endonuclease VapC